MTDEPRPGSLSGRLHASTTVLVVEDEQDIAGFLGAYFRASGLALVHVDPATPADAVTARERAAVSNSRGRVAVTVVLPTIFAATLISAKGPPSSTCTRSAPSE